MIQVMLHWEVLGSFHQILSSSTVTAAVNGTAYTPLCKWLRLCLNSRALNMQRSGDRFTLERTERRNKGDEQGRKTTKRYKKTKKTKSKNTKKNKRHASCLVRPPWAWSPILGLKEHTRDLWR